MKCHSFSWELATAKKFSTVWLASVTMSSRSLPPQKCQLASLAFCQFHLGACHWIANVVVSSRNLALIFNCLVRFFFGHCDFCTRPFLFSTVWLVFLGPVIFLRYHFLPSTYDFWVRSFYQVPFLLWVYLQLFGVFFGRCHFFQVPFFSFNYLVRFFGVQSFFSGAIFYLQLFGTFLGGTVIFLKCHCFFWFIFNCLARVFLCAVFLVRCHFLSSIVSPGFFWRQSFL